VLIADKMHLRIEKLAASMPRPPDDILEQRRLSFSIDQRFRDIRAERNHARLQTKSVWKLMVVMAIGVTSHNLDWIGSLNRGPQTCFRDKETIDGEKS
jgi:hypothetical protein